MPERSQRGLVLHLGMGWQGQGEEGHGSHHPLVSLVMKTPVGGRNRFHHRGAVILSWKTLRGISEYPSLVPQCTGTGTPRLDKQPNRGHQVESLGKAERNRRRSDGNDGNQVSPLCPLGNRTRCAVGQVGKRRSTQGCPMRARMGKKTKPILFLVNVNSCRAGNTPPIWSFPFSLWDKARPKSRPRQRPATPAVPAAARRWRCHGERRGVVLA